MKIEPAMHKDLGAIQALYEQLYARMAQLQPQNFRPARQNGEFLMYMMLGEDSDILIAREDGGRALGFALVRCQNTPEYPSFIPRRYAVLMDLAVEESRRRQGVGRALLEAVKAWARERGAEFLELGVLSQNLPAIGLYESFGFSESRRVMELELGGS